MNQKFKILIIEDEKNIILFLSDMLEANNFEVLSSYTGNQGISSMNSQTPDLILLDLGLPDMDGVEVIHQIRQYSNCPIIVVSARIQEQEKVIALEAGADDYITKPFGSSELIARIHTALRHSNKISTESILYKKAYTYKDLKIDFCKRLVLLHNETVHLTPVEYKIVSYLAQNSGKVITHSTLMSYVWGPYPDTDNKILRVNMANIRRKLETNPAQPEYIYTEVGVGYRMKEEPSAK